eukprot:5718456-Amphidinium_carterae.1
MADVLCQPYQTGLHSPLKEGDVRFLICTDVAARGIDIQAHTCCQQAAAHVKHILAVLKSQTPPRKFPKSPSPGRSGYSL